MVLIADSGSTKTHWALVRERAPVKILQTQGMNPYFTSSDLMRTILQEELILHLTGDDVSHIHFYGAGCSTENKNNLVKAELQRFFQHASIEIHHDILGAARALFGQGKGIASILGTGSNSCFYDGEEVFAGVPSLGYLFGDEGAGSNLGKKLMMSYFNGTLPPDLRTAFDKRYHFALEDILNSLYNKPFPNRFLAAFSLFLNDHKQNPFIRELIYSSFIEFIETHIEKYNDYRSYPVGFIGSIASTYQPILLEATASKGLTVAKILQTPVEGLVEYHNK